MRTVEVAEITKSGFKQIIDNAGKVRYQRPDGRFTTRKSFRLSARSEPGGAGQVKRSDRAEDFQPTEVEIPADLLEEVEPEERPDVFDIEEVEGWDKDPGINHIGVREIGVRSG